PVSTDTELGRYIREFKTRVRRDTDEIYSRLDDEQSKRQLLASRLNMLFRDRRAHAYTRHLMETEARLSREAWVRLMDASDLARGELPSASRREDIPEVTLTPRKRLDIALGPRYEGAPVSTDTELGGYVREFETRVRQDTDRRAHAYTRQLMETEARMSREAWVRATYASDLIYGEVMSLRTTVLGQMSEIRELQAADRNRQTVISELLRIDHRRSTEISELRTALQGQVTALQA
nr:hypothetical protein [Tanacetum cinerariifolium]